VLSGCPSAVSMPRGQRGFQVTVEKTFAKRRRLPYIDSTRRHK
jgi:hypothetical protein